MESFFPRTYLPSCLGPVENSFPTTATGRMRVPDRIGPFRRIGFLGEGAMGEVHLAEDDRFGDLVALKFSRFSLDPKGEEAIERFRRESRAAGSVPNAGVCSVRAEGQVGNLHYLAMDFIDGEPLSEVIKRRTDLVDQGEATRLIHAVSLAVAEVHARGVIHRDLKPSNIMIRRADGRPVIIDFGLAWLFLAGDSRLTKAGTILGTPYYMSPEQVNGDVEAMGPGCDIYSLGVVLYELLTGRLPFEGSMGSVLGKILFLEPEPPSTYRPGLDPRLERICRTAMSKEIASRFPSMVAMASALGEVA